MEVVLRLFRGEPLDAVSRELKVEISRLEAWRNKGLHGLEEALKEREGDPMQAQLDEVNRRLGELMMENELLREKARRTPGFLSGRSRK
jgi:hypothetical protein